MRSLTHGHELRNVQQPVNMSCNIWAIAITKIFIIGLVLLTFTDAVVSGL